MIRNYDELSQDVKERFLKYPQDRNLYLNKTKCLLGHTNEVYFIQSACLAFHKALLGISELRSLEKVETAAGGLRMSRGLFTYYSVFHLFCFVMVWHIMHSNLLRMSLDLPEKLYRKELIDNKEEKPSAWASQSAYERDVCSMITHTAIGIFCRNMRRGLFQEVREKPIMALENIMYENFVHHGAETDMAIPGLFEKLCYIRDRLIYRPTLIYPADTDEEPIQSSGEVKREIEGLPNSSQLLKVASSLHLSLINPGENTASRYKDIAHRFASFIWFSPKINEGQSSPAYKFSTADIVSLSGQVDENNISLPCYASHLIEIAENPRVIEDHNEIWLPLKREFLIEREKRHKKMKGLRYKALPFYIILVSLI